MTRRIAPLALTPLLLTPLVTNCASAEVSAASKEIANFDPVGQETALWCWAASAQMIMGVHGKEVTQTQLATDRANRKYRRKGDPEIKCDEKRLLADRKLKGKKRKHRVCYRGGWPEFDAYGFTFDERHCGGEERKRCALSWEELRRELDADRPVAFVWDDKQVGSHMMVAFGYLVVPDGSEHGSRWIWVADPMPPGEGDMVLVPWDLWHGGPYGHRRNLFNIRPAAGE